MASDARLAKLLGHIAACHTAVLPGARLPFYAGPNHLGFLLPTLAARLATLSPAISVLPDRVSLEETALPELNALARAAGLRTRGEDFDVRATPDGPALTVLDRGALPDFGVIGVGVHLNGLVASPDGPRLWVAKRAAHKKLDPGKLDHLVAGGVPAGLTPWDTLLKEAEEEAALPPALAAQARPTARFAYNMERPEGLRRDIVHAYDLPLAAAFTPQPADGEVESFALWPLSRVADILATTDDFKFNVALVLIDLLCRHGLFPPAHTATLRAALDRNAP
jgi:8-oxo-dGTP pyrophosphatase MutT (NUDIX family)